nr:unnamed protein product [Spirometra erinaceieuropaei]
MTTTLTTDDHIPGDASPLIAIISIIAVITPAMATAASFPTISTRENAPDASSITTLTIAPPTPMMLTPSNLYSLSLRTDPTHRPGRSPVNPSYSDRAPLLSSAPMELPFSLRRKILRRWVGHFRGVLNRPSAISDAATARLPQVETNAGFDLASSPHKTIKTVQQLFSGKASGSEAIPAEIYKHGGSQLMEHLTALFREMCCQVEVSRDFKDPTIVYLYERKGNRQIYEITEASSC